MTRLLLFLLLMGAVPAFAADLQVLPQAVAPGGVFWVRCAPANGQAAILSFAGRDYPLAAADRSAERLLGVDLDTDPGTYPVRLKLVDPSGAARRLEVSLKVTKGDFAEEHLNLPEEMVSPKGEDLLARIDRERARLLDLFAAAAGGPLPDAFGLPVADPPGSSFGLRRILNGQPRSPHSGVDFRSPLGRPVLAPAAGEVLLVDDLYYTGRTVVVDHGAGLVSLFAHLDRPLVVTGSRIESGAAVGLVGSSGRATGPHLHWSVRLNNARVDPLAVYRALSGKNLDSPEPTPDNPR